MVGKDEFNQRTSKKTMSTEQYLQHLKNTHEISKELGIPMGADALFGKAKYPELSPPGSDYSSSQNVPSEPIESERPWGEVEKERVYRMGANKR